MIVNFLKLFRKIWRKNTKTSKLPLTDGMLFDKELRSVINFDFVAFKSSPTIVEFANQTIDRYSVSPKP